MLPILLFFLIIVIAIFASWIYFRSASQSGTSNKTGHASAGQKTDGTSLSGSQQNLTLEERLSDTFEARVASDGNGKEDEIDHSKNIDYMRQGYRLFFVPTEAGTYHKINRLTERGWADLDYSLVKLSRVPGHVTELLNILKKPYAAVAQINDLCDQNPELSSRILKIVNSPFYELDETITDVRHAVVQLGYDEIRTVVLACSLFTTESDTSDFLKIDELWEHSLATAKISSWLADRCKIQIRKNLAGMGAILHDIGKLVHKQWRPEAFRKACQAAREKESYLMSEELRESGVTHAIAGVLLIDRLRLPVTLSWVVKGCHRPVIDTDLPEPALVYVAGQVARYMAIGADGEPLENRIPGEIGSFLGIKEETISDLVGQGLQGISAVVPDSMDAVV